MALIKVNIPGLVPVDWNTASGPLTLSDAGSGPTPPIPPQPPLGPPAGSPSPYTSVGQIAWPTKSQVRKTFAGNGPGWYMARIDVPTNLVTPKPTNTGFIRITEVPGTNTWARTLKIYRNNDPAAIYSVGQDGAPSANFCDQNPNFAQVGASWNNTPGDVLWVFWSSQCDPGQICSVLFDFATPERYG